MNEKERNLETVRGKEGMVAIKRVVFSFFLLSLCYEMALVLLVFFPLLWRVIALCFVWKKVCVRACMCKTDKTRFHGLGGGSGRQIESSLLETERNNEATAHVLTPISLSFMVPLFFSFIFLPIYILFHKVTLLFTSSLYISKIVSNHPIPP